MIHKKFIYLDSNKRISGTNSNFKYDIGKETLKPYDHICLISANIPKSYYLIEEDENTFTLQEDVKTVIISIPIGNYTRSNLKTTVQTLLNTNSPNGWTYTITIPPSTGADDGKFTFTVANNGSQPAFIFTDWVASPLGFNPNNTYTFVANSLISVNVPSLQLEDNIYIHCSLVRNDGNEGGDDILESISAIDNPYYGNILWVCPSYEMFGKRIVRPEQIISFRLTDENDNELELNGRNWTGTLLLYKLENSQQKQNDLMKLMISQNLLTSLNK